MKKLSLIALTAVSFALRADRAVIPGDSLRIAYVDMMEVMRTSKDGIDASKELEAKRKTLSDSLQDEDRKLSQRMNDYKAKATTLTENARVKEEKEIQKMQRELQERVQECEQDLQAAMQVKTGELTKEVESAALLVMEEERLDAVVDKASGRVICAVPKIDYTKRAVSYMDKSRDTRLASAKKAPEAKKAA